MKSLIDIIKLKSEESVMAINNLLDTCSVYYHNPNTSSGNLVFINPTVYHWNIMDETTTGTAEIIALKTFKTYISFYNLLINHFSSTQIKKIKSSQKVTLGLIERTIKAPISIDFAKKNVAERFQNECNLLHQISISNMKYCIVPDTNSLIQKPDPKEYKSMVPDQKFSFILIPTVLQELDKLKVLHRDELFRKKVLSVINRIKGYRTQGSLIEGITYYTNICIRSIAAEPKFENLFKWLDPNINDDRILASTLEIATIYPNNIVVLITSDINLQNKAELAGLCFLEPPI